MIVLVRDLEQKETFMKMYSVSFTADGFKTLIITAKDEAAAKLAVERAFNTVVFLSVKEVG